MNILSLVAFFAFIVYLFFCTCILSAGAPILAPKQDICVALHGFCYLGLRLYLLLFGPRQADSLVLVLHLFPWLVLFPCPYTALFHDIDGT